VCSSDLKPIQEHREKSKKKYGKKKAEKQPEVVDLVSKIIKEGEKPVGIEAGAGQEILQKETVPQDPPGSVELTACTVEKEEDETRKECTWKEATTEQVSIAMDSPTPSTASQLVRQIDLPTLVSPLSPEVDHSAEIFLVDIGLATTIGPQTPFTTAAHQVQATQCDLLDSTQVTWSPGNQMLDALNKLSGQFAPLQDIGTSLVQGNEVQRDIVRQMRRSNDLADKRVSEMKIQNELRKEAVEEMKTRNFLKKEALEELKTHHRRERSRSSVREAESTGRYPLGQVDSHSAQENYQSRYGQGHSTSRYSKQ
jgi:hypothetical protein